MSASFSKIVPFLLVVFSFFLVFLETVLPSLSIKVHIRTYLRLMDPVKFFS